jgi:hypothetical protein
MIYNFYSDGGHGWLRVSTAELERLGIRGDISHYSYSRGRFSYLEEDCDYSRFVAAKHARGETVELREHVSRYRDSRIRSYSRFCQPESH